MNSQSARSPLSVCLNEMVVELRETGKDVINLSLGEAIFQIPRFDFNPLDWERGNHYSDSRGLTSLREKICELYGREYSCNVDAKEQVMITAGSKIAIFMSMVALHEPRAKVAIFEPAWVSYYEQALLAGYEPYFLPFDDSINGNFSLTPGTKLVILNNPNNPSGRHYSVEEIRNIANTCDSFGARLLVDEAYSDFLGSGNFISAFSAHENVIVTNSLSKNLGMSGWRIGYVIANSSTINAILKVQQNLITCAPTLLQTYLSKNLFDIYSATSRQVEEIVIKRNEIAKYLHNQGLSTLEGDSTFYLMLDINSLGIKDDVTSFSVNLLLQHGVSVVPGSSYGSSMNKYLRISVGAEPTERIKEGLQALISSADNQTDRGDLIEKQKRMGLTSWGWLDW